MELRLPLFQVYALTRERDTLRREQNKKSDAAALLKEKDEIINQVMAEGVIFFLEQHNDFNALQSISDFKQLRQYPIPCHMEWKCKLNHLDMNIM